MTITLNHTIVPCFDNKESAQFYCKLFGFEYIGEFSRFIVVRVNDTLCLDFDSRDKFESNHYAFKVYKLSILNMATVPAKLIIRLSITAMVGVEFTFMTQMDTCLSYLPLTM